EIGVTDTGAGIAEKNLPRLTERFYRVDKTRSRELGGTGLGLAIVKHIVLAHSGELKFESVLNKGTTVRVFLPAVATERNVDGILFLSTAIPAAAKWRKGLHGSSFTTATVFIALERRRERFTRWPFE